MTGAPDPVPDPEGDLLAAELAFGLLDAPDRAAAEARAAGDPAFALACRMWQDHAAGLVDAAGEVPDAAVWAAIQRRLPANDDAIGTAALRRSVRLWRSTSLALALVALIAGTFALQRPQILPIPPVAIAAPLPTTIVLLTGAPDAGVMAIGYDRAAGRIASTSTGLAIGGHAAELWVIPADQRPRSLGVVRANVADARIEPAAVRALIAAGATLAITVEPAGGSPTGLPTGPVILSGKVAST